jgi:hypothetical protein
MNTDSFFLFLKGGLVAANVLLLNFKFDEKLLINIKKKRNFPFCQENFQSRVFLFLFFLLLTPSHIFFLFLHFSNLVHI